MPPSVSTGNVAGETRSDDKLTILAIALTTCFMQDVLHEALGHGVVAYLSGAKALTLSTVALSSDISTRPISAAGTLVNLAAGVIFWLLLRRADRYRPSTRFFFILAMAGNLFGATGYFFFSGVTNFGDWAEVIAGLQPHWLWRVGLIAIGIPAYYTAMLLAAEEMRAFKTAPRSARPRALCWIPYFTDGALAGIAGLWNPAGLFYVIASALPSTLGAQAGLCAMPSFLRQRHYSPPETPVGTIARSYAWIAVGAAAALIFIFVLGRGLTWHR